MEISQTAIQLVLLTSRSLRTSPDELVAVFSMSFRTGYVPTVSLAILLDTDHTLRYVQFVAQG